MNYREDTIKAVAEELQELKNAMDRSTPRPEIEWAQEFLDRLKSHKGVVVVDLPRKAIEIIERLNTAGLWGVLFEDTLNEVILSRLREIAEKWGE